MWRDDVWRGDGGRGIYWCGGMTGVEGGLVEKVTGVEGGLVRKVTGMEG